MKVELVVNVHKILSQMYHFLRYTFIIIIFGIGLVCFNIVINFYIYGQICLSFINKEFNKIPNNYDYIIVGSGTAGSILAYRLSQNKNNKILLLEAGTYSNFLLDIPALGPVLQKTNFDWQYETIPQNYACKAMEKNISLWPMGRIFGGTHQLNNMIHSRGHKQDYDEWFASKNDYSYENDVLYYYKKLENSINTNTDGPLHIDDLNYESSLPEAILEAAKNLNSCSCTGFRKPQVTTKNNQRWTISHSLLEKRFTNLNIITNAVVNKIIFKNNFEASGVQYNLLGDLKIARAKKGVILSAGTIGSPKILLLSGIGPPEHLNKVKIRPKKNLPVGENLQDHITTGLDLILLNQTLNINIASLISPISVFNYFFNNSGPWVSVGCEVVGFCQTNSSLKPNLQFMIIPTGITSDGGTKLKKLIGIKSNVWNEYFIKLYGKQTISILPIILHPNSRGKVKLKSNNPNLNPIIDPNYLSHPNDIQILLEGINIIKKLINSTSMQKLGAKINPQSFPGCTDFEFDSENYWRCYIRHLTLTSYHPIGTCAMGNAQNSNSVVDFNFKVIGTNKLFVIDGSILPSLPSGNPNSVIGMMAERGADSVQFLQFLSIGHCRKIEIFLKTEMCLILDLLFN